jgi:ligand-binding sensor domain-containing protein
VRSEGADAARVDDVVAANDGTVWTATETQGLLRFYPTASGANSSPEEHFTHRDGLSGDYAFSVLQDREGSIWVATTKGLDHFRPFAFRAVELNEGAIVTLPKGASSPRTMIATDRLMELTTGVPVPLTPSFQDWVSILLRADDGALWVGTSTHLWRYTDGHLTPQDLPTGLRGARPSIQAIVEDGSHKIWLSLAGNGLYRLDGNRWEHFSGYSEPAHQPAVCAARDNSGSLWFGLTGGKVMSIREQQVHTVGRSDGLDIGDVKVFATAGGGLWIGGDNGVAVLRDTRFVPLVLDGGLALHGVTGIAFAPNGDLWINHSAGVTQISNEEIAAQRSNAQHAVRYRSFDYRDGLQGIPNSLVGLGSAWMAPDGRLYIATRTNLQWIDPMQLPHNSLPPQVLITELKADDQSAPLSTDVLTVKPRVSVLQNRLYRWQPARPGSRSVSLPAGSVRQRLGGRRNSPAGVLFEAPTRHVQFSSDCE